MDQQIIDTAAIFMGNGYGMGIYQEGFIFMKNTSENYLLYLTNKKMSILEKEERKVVFESSHFSQQKLDEYFTLNYEKKSLINWFAPVNIKILSEDSEMTRKNIIYFFYPTIQISFSEEILPNTIIIYDKTVSTEQIDTMKQITLYKGMSQKVEFWSKIKLVAMSDRMGNLATKGCFDKAMAAYEKAIEGCCGSGCSDCNEE